MPVESPIQSRSSVSGNLPVVLLLLLLLLVAYSFYRPQAAYPGDALVPGLVVPHPSSLGIMVVCVASCCLFFTTSHRTIRKGIWFALALFGVFLLWSLVKCLSAPVPAFGRKYLGTFLLGFWMIGASYLLTSMVASGGPEWLTKKHSSLLPLALMFGILAAFLSIHALFQYLGGYEQQYREYVRFHPERGSLLTEGIKHALREKRVSATLGASNIFAAFLAVSFPFLLSLSGGARTLRGRCLALAGLLLTLVALYLTRSRGGLLSLLLFAVPVTIYLCMKHRVFRSLVSSSLAALLSVLILSGVLIHPPLSGAQQPSTPTQLNDAPDLDSWSRRLTAVSTLKQRIYYAQTGWKIIQRNPVWGNGLASYSVFYPRYRIEQAGETQHAHNLIVELWADLGLVGLLLFAVFLLVLFKEASHRVAATSIPQTRILQIACIAAMVTFLANSLFEYTFYSREMFLAFCLVAGSSMHQTGSAASTTRPRGRFRLPALLVFTGLSVLFFVSFLWKPAYGEFYRYKGEDASGEAEYETQNGNRTDALVYYRKALDFYQLAVAAQEDNPFYLARLSAAVRFLGRSSEAEELLKRAILINPHSASLKADLADLYRFRMDFDRAITLTREAISLYPFHHRYHFQLGELLVMKGDRDEAAEEFQKAIRYVRYESQRKPIETRLEEISRDPEH